MGSQYQRESHVTVAPPDPLLLCCVDGVHRVSVFPIKANELLQGSRQIQNKTDKERTLRESLQLYQQISQHTDLPLVCFQYRQGKGSLTQSLTHLLLVQPIGTHSLIYSLTHLLTPMVGSQNRKG